jgi:hypothetical protein
VARGSVLRLAPRPPHLGLVLPDERTAGAGGAGRHALPPRAPLGQVRGGCPVRSRSTLLRFRPAPLTTLASRALLTPLPPRHLWSPPPPAQAGRLLLPEHPPHRHAGHHADALRGVGERVDHHRIPPVGAAQPHLRHGESEAGRACVPPRRIQRSPDTPGRFLPPPPSTLPTPPPSSPSPRFSRPSSSLSAATPPSRSTPRAPSRCW